MSADTSDALVVYGITGDLAYKKIFPALHALERRGRLTGPVIGVARSVLSYEELVARADARSRPNGFSTTTRAPRAQHPASARCSTTTGNIAGGIAR